MYIMYFCSLLIFGVPGGITYAATTWHLAPPTFYVKFALITCHVMCLMYIMYFCSLLIFGVSGGITYAATTWHLAPPTFFGIICIN